MNKFFVTLLSFVVVASAFGADAHYNCNFQSETATSMATLKFSVGNLICGHKGVDGCDDGVYVPAYPEIPVDKSEYVPIYKCDKYWANDWESIHAYQIPKCETKELPEYLGKFDDNFIYYAWSGHGQTLSDFCRIDAADAEYDCTDSGGKWDWNKDICDCSHNKRLRKAGGLAVSPCECKEGFKRDKKGKCVPESRVKTENVVVENAGGGVPCGEDNRELVNGECECGAACITTIEESLDEMYDSLGATLGGFEKSEWRDENGNLNTARLASDGIAGVVLGTVGGVVTASLVKKSQLKQGFEDISCYISGQEVAGYGDEFIVGR